MFGNPRKPDDRKSLPGPTHTPTPGQQLGGVQGLADARELFWQNVIREMLTSLSIISGSKSSPPKDAVIPLHSPASSEDLFDGRLAVITSLGQRIPIAAVYPLFACGIRTTEADKALSMAVECTVFQIHTPGGEVFTLPLHEIRSFHSLSEDLIQQLNDAVSERGGDGDQNEPFGFAAYTSLARSKFPAEIINPATPNITGPGLPG